MKELHLITQLSTGARDRTDYLAPIPSSLQPCSTWLFGHDLWYSLFGGQVGHLTLAKNLVESNAKPIIRLCQLAHTFISPSEKRISIVSFKIGSKPP